MAAIIRNRSWLKFYNFVFHELGDERTENFFLIRSPIPGVLILAFYYYFVKSLGPKLMANRKPFELKTILILYNAFQIIANAFILYEVLDGAYLRDYSIRCEPVDISRSPKAMRIVYCVYYYFLTRLIDLLDTVFFVLRKKDRQITFLHMYHHICMPMISWGATKYYPGGHGIFLGVVNCFVHVVMYTYYLLAALGPQYQKYLWWKKYITKLQLVQFCVIFLHTSQLIFYDCGYPRWYVFLALPNGIFFYVLFSEFYNEAYTKKNRVPSNNTNDVSNNKLNNKEMNGCCSSTASSQQQPITNGKFKHS